MLKGLNLQGISTKLAKSSFRFSHNSLWEMMALTRQDILYPIRTFLEKEMATHSSVLAWRIPEMAEPGGLPSVGSNRVGRD